MYVIIKGGYEGVWIAAYHAKKIDQIAVEVVIYLEGIRLLLK